MIKLGKINLKQGDTKMTRVYLGLTCETCKSGHETMINS